MVTHQTVTNTVHQLIILYFNTGVPALYMCLTIPLGFTLNGERHYGSDTMSVTANRQLWTNSLIAGMIIFTHLGAG